MPDVLLIPNCIVCNEPNCLRYLNEKLKILTCTKCDAIYNEHEFSEKIFYNRNFSKPSIFKFLFYRLTHIRISQTIADEYIKYLKSKTKMNFKNVLDIGAYYGTFVNNLNKMGINARGIESDQSFIELALTKNIEFGYFDESYTSNDKYDLICLTQMIYLMRDNYAILKRVKNMLTPDGLIFITTTNANLETFSSWKSGKRYSIGANMVLSNKNYESFCNKLGLEILDYTSYRMNLSKKKISYLKFILKLKRPMVPDSEGDQSFILLKNLRDNTK